MYIFVEPVLEASVFIFLVLHQCFGLNAVVEHFLPNKNAKLLIMSTYVVKFVSRECGCY